MNENTGQRLYYGTLIEIARKTGTSPQYVRNIKRMMGSRSRFAGVKARKIAKLIEKEMQKTK